MSKTSHWILIWGTVLILLAALIYRWYAHRHSLAGLYVSSSVPATVWLDNTLLGEVPFRDEKIEPGTHLLRVVPENDFYLPLETSVVLESGYLTVVAWQWQEETGKSFGLIYEISDASESSSVTIDSRPDRALVSWHNEGQPLFAPAVIESVETGEHTFTVSLPGFENLSGVVEIGKRQKITVTAQLRASTGSTTTETGETENASASGEINTDITELVKILPTNFFDNEKEVLRVRDQANASGAQLGLVAVGETLPYLGETENGWYKVLFEDKSGWVSSDFSEIQ